MTTQTITVKGLDAYQRDIDPRILGKAHLRSLTRTRITLKKEVNQKLRKRYIVKAARINKDLKNSGAKPRQVAPERLRIALEYVGRRLNLSSFAKSTQRRVMSKRGVRYQATSRVMKGGRRKKVAGQDGRGGFLGTARNALAGQGKLIFERTGVVRESPRYKNDQKLRSLTGPAIAQMVRNEKVLDETQTRAFVRYQEVMKQELNFRLRNGKAA